MKTLAFTACGFFNRHYCSTREEFDKGIFPQKNGRWAKHFSLDPAAIFSGTPCP